MRIDAIDLFAGAGGFTEGAEQAGVNVVWAANHWPAAVKTHAANHPRTRHACQDLKQANWLEVPRHDLLLASPCCQGHSPARGKAANNPQHDASRATAWAVVDALECHRPRLGGLVENVPGFLKWSLYPAWELAVQKLGYSIGVHIADTADHGVPQHRERLFLVLTRSRAPLQLKVPRRDHVSATSFIDFTSGNWSPINTPRRVPKTLARIAAGRASFGDRFVMPYYSKGSGLTGRSMDRPIGAITTVDRWAVVDGDRMRMLTTDEYRVAMSFRHDYILPKQKKLAVNMLGNAVAPLQACDFIAARLRAA